MQQSIDIRVAPNGRMVLPRAIRDLLGVTGSGVVVASIEDGEIKLTSIKQSVSRAQELYRTHVKDNQSSDALLASRREEAEKEQ